MSQVWSNFQHTVRAIAQEAVETAKELREAHNHEGFILIVQPEWIQEQGGEEGNLHSPPSSRTSAKISQQSVPPALSSSSTAAAAAVTTSEPPRSDVTSRLAALKAKLQADKTHAVPPPDRPQPTSQVGLPSRSDAGSEEAAQVSALKEQLQETKAELLKIQGEHREARNQQQKAIATAVQEALSREQERHVEELRKVQAEATAATTEAHAAAQHEEVHRLRLEALTTADKLAQEQSRAAAYEKTAEELRIQLEKSIERDQEASSQREEENMGVVADLERSVAQARAESAALREEIARLSSDTARVGDGHETLLDTTPGKDDNRSTNTDGEKRLVQDLKVELQTAINSLAASDAERASLKQQLTRLKAQMLGEQDDEEQKVKWRVDAEVKLALEAMGANVNRSTTQRAGGEGTGSSNSMNTIMEAQLRSELAEALEKTAVSEAAAIRWESIASARDAELANMQRALGELTYEAESAERLRAELRAMHAEVHALRNDVDAGKVAKIASEGALTQAREDAAGARAEAAAARHVEAQLQREVLEARVALQNAERELRRVQGGGMLERGAVLQALTGLVNAGVPRRRARGAVQVVAQTLGLTDEEVAALLRGDRGDGGVVNGGADTPSLAWSWIRFLESQAAAESEQRAQSGEGSIGAEKNSGLRNAGESMPAPPPLAAAAAPAATA